MMSLRLNFNDLATIAIQGLIACFLAFSLTSVAWAAEKLNLVLLPIEVSQSERAYEDEYGSAVQKGLAQHYTVFYGADVERQLQKEYSKLDCTAESCNQNVAIAFNGELIADASVTKVSGGYLLKLVITNVLTNEVVLSETNACRGCDLFDVIPALENLISNPLGTSGQLGQTTAPTVAQSAARAILIFDTEPSGATVFAADKMMGTTPYQGLDFKVGDILQFDIRKDGYDRLPLQVELKTPITQLETLALSPSLGKVTLTIDPFQNGTDIYIDGQKVGIAPVMLELGVGYYYGFAENADHTSEVKDILVTAHSDEVTTFTFADKQEIANIVDNVVGDESTTFSTPESNDNENYEVVLAFQQPIALEARDNEFINLDNNHQRIQSGSDPAACVLDRSTGLVWESKTKKNAGETYTIKDALTYAKKANSAGILRKSLCGLTGWRMPTKIELLSITLCTSNIPSGHLSLGEVCGGLGFTSPVIDNSVFPYTQPGFYWTGMNLDARASSGWAVNFYDGQNRVKDGTAHLRLVTQATNLTQ